MEDTFLKLVEDKKLHYGKNLRELIPLITRVQGKVNLDDTKVFGKHIHAFSWAFFTGYFYERTEIPEKWEHTDTFSIGTFLRDGAEDVAYTMLMIGLNETKINDIEKDLTSQNGIREILNNISKFAEGGAKYILEKREGDDPVSKTYLNNIEHFFDEIHQRLAQKE
ncbi:hypothetical protein RM549_03045 [Salegentibacter sp. F188]|uniref:Uncharacterized protein n=1 Tax=Autumnicola patrickiae TaxID=3075591 RepID=A0ABU3DYG6_9FLAO|nr:hypothetical protein [Salegentibacter sp. F188]MDT0688742.1 hypothetical protein [Salegentibacter sp. F188]